MGLIDDMLFGMADDAAERVAGERGRRVMPSGPARAILLLVLLTAWILAVGLVLTGLVWLLSGALPEGAGAAVLGAGLAWMLTRVTRRLRPR